jgi:hypothetical protein
MSERKTAAPADALFALLRSSLSASGEQSFGHLVLYTSFGVVRGRIGLTFAQGLIGKENVGAESESPKAVIEINDVTVEHYSNHLANATLTDCEWSCLTLSRPGGKSGITLAAAHTTVTRVRTTLLASLQRTTVKRQKKEGQINSKNCRSRYGVTAGQRSLLRRIPQEALS